MKLLAISRSSEFSPNMVENDAAILASVVRILRLRGHEAVCLSEQDFVQTYSDATAEWDFQLVIGMERGAETLRLLSEAETLRGIPVINSAVGIARASRVNQTLLFRSHSIPMPDSWIIPDETPLPEGFPCWLKRGEGCAQVRDDVVFVPDAEKAASALSAFRRRGVMSPIVASRHLDGDLVKFYGVEGTDFFAWKYAAVGQGKFGLEARNGEPHGYPFSVERLRQTATRAARILSLPVYGGDAVVSPDGGIRIIDFNDWPSFSSCCEQAAEAIAQRIDAVLAAR